MTKQSTFDGSMNFDTAVEVHAALEKQTVSAVRFGNFYANLLKFGPWTSQASLSRQLGVSTAKVSRALMAARLPEEVVRAFHDGEGVTYRRAHAISLLIEALGVDVVRKRAKLLPELPALTVEQFVLAVVREPSMGRNESTVSLVVDERSRSVRMESPHMERLLPHLRELERVLVVSADFLLASVNRGGGLAI
jgi:hypothetical protein